MGKRERFAMSAVLWLVIASSPSLFGQAPEKKSIGGSAPIRDVASILALPRAVASSNVPVKIRGVITCFQRRTQLCFVQDGTAGIYVYGIDPTVELAPGSLVEIAGVTDAGRYSPIIKEVSIRLLGETNLPTARLITVTELRAGTEDAQWIQMRGVVLRATQTLGYTSLEIASGGSLFHAQILEPVEAGITNLVDSLVSIRGVAGAAYDAQGKITGFNVYLSGERFIEVIRRGAADPYQSPRAAVADLVQFAHRRLQPHRVLVQGAVTARRGNGVFYVRDATGSIEVQPDRSNTVSPGDTVEAAGFPGDDLLRPVLREAVFRKTGSGPVPLPVKLPSAQVRGSAFENEFISIEGTLLGSTSSRSNLIILLVAGGNQNFTMTAERAEDIPSLARLTPGSVLRVAGIWQSPDAVSSPTGSAQLWLPSAERVEVIKAIHPWTGGEVALLTGLAFLVPTAGFWLARRAARRRSGAVQVAQDCDHNVARRYHELFENASDVICTMDPTGQITSLNRSGISLLGYSDAEARGLNISQLVVPSDWPRLRPLLEAKGEDKKAASEEFELVPGTDGTSFCKSTHDLLCRMATLREFRRLRAMSRNAGGPRRS